MDHSKITCPHFSHKNKATDSFMKLPIAVTGMIAHEHGDMRYAHCSLDIYLSNLNHTIGSIAELLRNLESLPVYSTRQMFVGGGSSPLFKALLIRVAMCEGSLLPPPESLVEAATLPPVLNIQLDNACSDEPIRTNMSLASFLYLFRRGYSAKSM